jgi:putative endonuclease
MTNDTSKELGKKGEEIAAKYLKKEGYRILARNWFCDRREIDIIARQGDQIVIVEVKTREGDYFEEPWEAVSTAKIRNIVEAAEAWLIQMQVDLETRFDVISIVFSDEVNYELTHFQDAFTPPVN